MLLLVTHVATHDNDDDNADYEEHTNGQEQDPSCVFLFRLVDNLIFCDTLLPLLLSQQAFSITKLLLCSSKAVLQVFGLLFSLSLNDGLVWI